MAELSPQIIKTDTLKVEIFPLAQVDLSLRFLYRIVEPVPMIWQNDGRVSYSLLADFGKLQQTISDFLLDKWNRIVKESRGSITEEEWNSENIRWLREVTNVNVVEMNMQAMPTNTFLNNIYRG
jgi:hypothetical protein